MNELKKIIYNCKHATFLIEKKQLAKLTMVEKVKLRIHLTGCSVCRVFQQQSIIINKMVKEMFFNDTNTNSHLDDVYKKDLQHKIEERLKKK